MVTSLYRRVLSVGIPLITGVLLKCSKSSQCLEERLPGTPKYATLNSMMDGIYINSLGCFRRLGTERGEDCILI